MHMHTYIHKTHMCASGERLGALVKQAEERMRERERERGIL